MEHELPKYSGGPLKQGSEATLVESVSGIKLYDDGNNGGIVNSNNSTKKSTWSHQWWQTLLGGKKQTSKDTFTTKSFATTVKQGGQPTRPKPSVTRSDSKFSADFLVRAPKRFDPSSTQLKINKNVKSGSLSHDVSSTTTPALNITGTSATTALNQDSRKKPVSAIKKSVKESHYGPNYVPRGPSAEYKRSALPSKSPSASSLQSRSTVNKSPTRSPGSAPVHSTPTKPVPQPNTNQSTSTKKPVTKEDEERNKRHSEVVAILSGRKKLPEAFASQYHVGEVLGDGAFGFVLTATCRKTNKEVAVKFIIKEKVPKELWDPESKLPVEIRMLSMLSHPNIIKYLGHYDAEEYILLVSELHGTQWDPTNPELNATKNPGLRETARLKTPVNPDAKLDCSPLFRLTPEQEKSIKRRTSCDLFECIDAHKQIPEEISRKIIAQIALAVQYLQESGIVHRDLKDENVVIDSHYNVKIVDFGSASKIPQSKSQYFTKFNGTAHFASPEIACGNSYRGPEAEIWSMGVLLFTIVCGENPFQNRNEIIKGKYSFPCKVSPDCQNLIARMLTYNEKSRATIYQVLEHRWLRPEVEKLREQYAYCQ